MGLRVSCEHAVDIEVDHMACAQQRGQAGANVSMVRMLLVRPQCGGVRETGDQADICRSCKAHDTRCHLECQHARHDPGARAQLVAKHLRRVRIVHFPENHMSNHDSTSLWPLGSGWSAPSSATRSSTKVWRSIGTEERLPSPASSVSIRTTNERRTPNTTSESRYGSPSRNNWVISVSYPG